MTQSNANSINSEELMNLIKMVAPIFVIDREDEYFPEDPMSFLRASRFRHHRGFRGDQGWSKSQNRWISGDSHSDEFYDIPCSVINSYGLWADGRNRRPRDDNAGNRLNVFLQPKGKRGGVPEPTGRVPAYYHSLPTKQGEGLFFVIKYWIFHGYSKGIAGFNHQGDWEGIAVGINTTREPEFVSYGAHGEYNRVPWNQVNTQNGRPLSFIEKGTHANFWQGRSGHVGGHEWNILSTLESIEHQPWRDFAGAWGEVGELAQTTGPLGPLFKTEY